MMKSEMIHRDSNVRLIEGSNSTMVKSEADQHWRQGRSNSIMVKSEDHIYAAL